MSDLDLGFVVSPNLSAISEAKTAIMHSSPTNRETLFGSCTVRSPGSEVHRVGVGLTDLHLCFRVQ